MFSCEALRAQLSNLLDEDVPRDVRAQIDRHLAECRTCQVIVDSARKTIRIVTDSGSFELDSGLSERLTALVMTAIRQAGEA
jgi:predicted anti-sigma-YlaC factor YlaD